MAATASGLTQSLKLPRLRLKEELLKSTPELGKLLGEDVDSLNETTFQPPAKNGRGMSSLKTGRTSSGQQNNGLESPRLFEEELTEEELVKLELEEVKRERAVLMQSLAHVKQDAGTTGGEAQQADIRQLEKELELKKQKLNELREEGRLKEDRLVKMRNQHEDYKKLMPEDGPSEQSTIRQLKNEMKKLENELIEAEAKNRLYYLLGERTRNEHMAMEKKVGEAREMKEDCLEDHKTLTQHMHDMRAAKEEGEKQLAHMRKMYEEAKKDWNKKLRDRRKEVRELERRQAAEREREDRKRQKQLEKERQDREAAAKVQMEREAYELQVQALAPKIEAMEASWNRLRTISGAETPDDVIAYWEGLRAKEENMRELVKLAEKRETKAKEDIQKLLQARSEMYEGISLSAEDEQDETELKIKETNQNAETLKTKFSKIRSVCISCEQGLQSLLERLMIALKEVPVDHFKQPLPPSPTSPSSRRLSKTMTEKRQISHTHRPSMGQKQSQRLGSSGSSENRALSPVDRPKSPQRKELRAVDDAQFFRTLPEMFEKVSSRLKKFVDIESQIVSRIWGEDAEQIEAEEGEDEAQQGLPPNEKALTKGMRRRTWTGPPMLETINRQSHKLNTLDLAQLTKKKKGNQKKQKGGTQTDLTRLLGYSGPEVTSVVEPPPESEEEEGEWDGVMDRDFIKHRAIKFTMKHENAKKNDH